MKAPGFATTITVENTAAEVFNAINNVRGWWSEEIEGNTDTLHQEWTYHFQDVHRCKMKIIELVPNRRIAWQVIDNYFSFTRHKEEWTGNKIIFEIFEKHNKTQLLFTHVGLVPEYECYDICENAWTTYIQKSLQSLVTTGSGFPNGKDKPQTDNEKKMTAADFTTTFFVDNAPAEVYTAINDVAGWWQGEIEGHSKKLNDEFTSRMQDIHFSKQKLVELVPNQKVVWLITDSKLNFLKQKDEWTGTTISFEISEINNKTQLRFTHFGLSPQIECYKDCSNAWSRLVQESLLSLITTGKGVKIF